MNNYTYDSKTQQVDDELELRTVTIHHGQKFIGKTVTMKTTEPGVLLESTLAINHDKITIRKTDEQYYHHNTTQEALDTVVEAYENQLRK